MAESIPLPAALKNQGWKVKIRDRERVEPPHVTVLYKTRAWRWGLRNRDFLDDEPDPSDVSDEVLQHLRQEETYERCVAAWDRMYPHNPVSSPGDEDNG